MRYDIKYSELGTEPITSTLVKAYCKVDYPDEDTLITLMITSLRQQVEEFTGRSLIAKTMDIFYPDFNSDEKIYLPFPDHDEITSVKVNGTAITDYVKSGVTQFCIIVPSSYSVGSSNNFGLQVTVKALGTCPESIKLEMLRLINESYRNRGNTFEGAIAHLDENAYANLAKYCLM